MRRTLSGANFQNGGQAKERKKKNQSDSATNIQHTPPVRKVNTRKKDTKLYEITKVDKTNKRLKIHYIGYSTRFNECRPFGDDEVSEYFPFVRKENPSIPSETSIEDRTQSFHCLLFREIKKRLCSGRREDPEINIDLNVDQDVFKEGLGSVLPPLFREGRWFTDCSQIGCLIQILVLIITPRIPDRSSTLFTIAERTD